MTWAAWLGLRLFHVLYAIFLAAWSVYTRWFDTDARSLKDTRSKIPLHLAITLVGDEGKIGDSAVQDAFLTCAERAVFWCQQAGIRRLTLYDRHGILLNAAGILKQRISAVDSATMQPERYKPTFVYPLTPPASDDSDSQFSGEESLGDNFGVITIYPEHPENELVRKTGRNKGALRRRGSRRTSLSSPAGMMVQVASQTAGKLEVAAVANKLLLSRLQNTDLELRRDIKGISMTVTELQYILEGENGCAAPDLMIVHHVTCPSRQRPPMELQAFPPWQIRLTEFYYDGSWPIRTRLLHNLAPSLAHYNLLTELEMRKALDEYAGAQFRIGR